MVTGPKTARPKGSVKLRSINTSTGSRMHITAWEPTAGPLEASLCRATRPCIQPSARVGPLMPWSAALPLHTKRCDALELASVPRCGAGPNTSATGLTPPPPLATIGPHQGMGVHHPNSRAHPEVWESITLLTGGATPKRGIPSRQLKWPRQIMEVHQKWSPSGPSDVATRPTCGPLLFLSPALKRWGPPRRKG